MVMNGSLKTLNSQISEILFLSHNNFYVILFSFQEEISSTIERLQSGQPKTHPNIIRSLDTLAQNNSFHDAEKTSLSDSQPASSPCESFSGCLKAKRHVSNV